MATYVREVKGRDSSGRIEYGGLVRVGRRERAGGGYELAEGGAISSERGGLIEERLRVEAEKAREEARKASETQAQAQAVQAQQAQVKAVENQQRATTEQLLAYAQQIKNPTIPPPQIPGLKKTEPVSKQSEDKLKGFEKRIERLQQYEQEVNVRSAQASEGFRVIPGLRGDNFAQRGARYALSLPSRAVTELPERANIAVQKTFAATEGVLRKETRKETLKEVFVEAPKQIPQAVAESYNPKTPEGLVNIAATALGVKKYGFSRASKTSVQVVESKSATASASFEGKTIDVTKTGFDVKAGNRQFKATSESFGVTKPDIKGTSIRSEKTAAVITEVGKERTFPVVSRTETQIKTRGEITKAKGATTQVVDINGRSFQQSGVVSSLAKQKNDLVKTKTYVELSKPEKTKSVQVNDIKPPESLPKPQTASIGVSKTKTFLEFEAPLKPEIFKSESFGVQLETKPVIQKFTETKTSGVSGTKVLGLAQKPVVFKKELSVKTTESGKVIVDVSKNVQPPKPQFKQPEFKQEPSTITTQIKPVITPSSTTIQAVQIQKAVETIVKETTPKPKPPIYAFTVSKPAKQEINTQTETKQFSEQKPSEPSQQIKPVSFVSEKVAQESKITPAQQIKPSRIFKTTQEYKPSQRPIDLQKPSQQFKPAQKTFQETQPEQRFKPAPITKPFSTPIIPIIPEQKTGFFIKLPSDSKKPFETGFDVFVRRKGKFEKANREALTSAGAKGFGARVVRETAAATFQIRPSAQKVRKTGSFIPTNLSDFYSSRKEKNTFIQKASKRISTAGEKREITFAPRKNKVFRL